MINQNLNLMKWLPVKGSTDETKVLHLKPAGATEYRPYSEVSRGFEYQREAQLDSMDYDYRRLTDGQQLQPIQHSDGWATYQQLRLQGWQLVDQFDRIVQSTATVANQR